MKKKWVLSIMFSGGILIIVAGILRCVLILTVSSSLTDLFSVSILEFESNADGLGGSQWACSGWRMVYPRILHCCHGQQLAHVVHALPANCPERPLQPVTELERKIKWPRELPAWLV